MNNNINKDFTKLTEKQFLDYTREELYQKLNNMRELLNLPQYRIDNCVESLISGISTLQDDEISSNINKVFIDTTILKIEYRFHLY